MKKIQLVLVLRFLRECVGLYHTRLSTYACQSAACDLTTGFKSEAARGHLMGPQHTHTHTHRSFTLSLHVFVLVDP